MTHGRAPDWTSYEGAPRRAGWYDGAVRRSVGVDGNLAGGRGRMARQPVSVELLPAREPAEPEGEEGDHDAGEVVGDVVPAEVEGRDDGDGEVGPEDDVQDLVAQRVLHHQRDEQGDRDVERGEAGHGLHGPLRAVTD